MINLDKAYLVDLLNVCIDYGGDLGGPYFTNKIKLDLIEKLKQIGLVPVFDKYGWIKDLEEK